MTSPASRGAVLIAAISGRALAKAAARAGYQPLVADLFADLDTRDIAAAAQQVSGSLESGFDEVSLMESLRHLASGRAPVGLVYGSGFEGRVGLLESLGREWQIYGNRPEVVARVKDPIGFAALCARLGIPHPETVASRPAIGGDWLAKRAGAAGGGHIRPAQCSSGVDPQIYFQARAEGVPVSALFLADGRRARVVGYSRQWAAPSSTRPYRFCGVARGEDVEPRPAPAMCRAVDAIVGETGLVGLNSADFLVDRDAFVLLEINPRPGASLDVFADRDGRLFACHIAACSGRLDEQVLHFDEALASCIVYASRDVVPVPRIEWPEWAADRQPPGTAVQAEEPLCTVIAAGMTGADAAMTADRRADAIRRQLQGDDA